MVFVTVNNINFQTDTNEENVLLLELGTTQFNSQHLHLQPCIRVSYLAVVGFDRI